MHVVVISVAPVQTSLEDQECAEEITSEEKKIERRPSLSMLALMSFVASFAAARTFTTLNPRAILSTGGFHIHHFWFGIIMLAIGGWLGLSYGGPRIDRLAAILFGAGGGLIGDEVGILLTFESENYWAGISYTFVIILIAFAPILALLSKYSKTIFREFTEFSRSHLSLYFGVFLATISVAFLTDADNTTVVAVSGFMTMIACLIILSYFIQRIRARQQKKRKSVSRSSSAKV
jgi:hypothetical protein